MILRQLKRQHGFQNTFINQKAGNNAAKCLLRNLIDCSRKKRSKQLHHHKRRDKPVMSHHDRKYIPGKLPDALSGWNLPRRSQQKMDSKRIKPDLRKKTQKSRRAQLRAGIVIPADHHIGCNNRHAKALQNGASNAEPCDLIGAQQKGIVPVQDVQDGNAHHCNDPEQLHIRLSDCFLPHSFCSRQKSFIFPGPRPFPLRGKPYRTSQWFRDGGQ